MHCSLLVKTHQIRTALTAVLASVRRQSRLPDEVIIADGSASGGMRALLLAEAATFPTVLRHVWDEDDRGRSAWILNRAIAACRGDYVICIERNTILHPAYIADHLALAAQGAFLHGGSLATTADYSSKLIGGAVPIFAPWTPVQFTAAHGEKRQHNFRWRWLAKQKARSSYPGLTVASSNMSFWREDLVRVNGYNGRIQEPGREDLDIDVRLRNCGIQRHRLRYAGLAMRLHGVAAISVDPDDMSVPSNHVLRDTALRRLQRCDVGLDRYLDEYREPPPDLRSQAAQSA